LFLFLTRRRGHRDNNFKCLSHLLEFRQQINCAEQREPAIFASRAALGIKEADRLKLTGVVQQLIE
jgi:hypothetical protein